MSHIKQQKTISQFIQLGVNPDVQDGLLHYYYCQFCYIHYTKFGDDCPNLLACGHLICTKDLNKTEYKYSNCGTCQVPIDYNNIKKNFFQILDSSNQQQTISTPGYFFTIFDNSGRQKLQRMDRDIILQQMVEKSRLIKNYIANFGENGVCITINSTAIIYAEKKSKKIRDLVKVLYQSNSRDENKTNKISFRQIYLGGNVYQNCL